MTTTKNQLISLAARMYQNAQALSEEPFAGSSVEATRLGEQFAWKAVDDLNMYLVLVLLPALNPVADSIEYAEWLEITNNSSTWDAWQEA